MNPNLSPSMPPMPGVGLPKDRNPLLIPLIVMGVFEVAVLGFAIWAFMGMQDYKNNVDQKIDVAVAEAEEALTIKKNAEFAEEYKKPYATYVGPAAYGKLTINYPKTWSNYLDGQGNTPIDGYMQPMYVSANKNETNYALRYQVVERGYDQEIKSFDSKVKSGKVTASPYRLPLLESELGMRITGELDSRKEGVMIILPLRDKSIKIWTEGSEYRNDFEEILKQLTFSP